MGSLQGWQITVLVSVVAAVLIIAVVVLLARIASSKRSEGRPGQPEEQWKRTDRLHIIEGLIQATNDPHRFLEVVLSAADNTTAEAALEDQFGWSREQARAAMNMQFWMMSEETLQSIRTEADDLRR